MPIPLRALYGMKRVAAIASAATTAMNAIFIILDIWRSLLWLRAADARSPFLSVHSHYSEPSGFAGEQVHSAPHFFARSGSAIQPLPRLRNCRSQPDRADSHR